MARKPSLIGRIALSLASLGISLLLVEFYLRQEVAHVVQKGVASAHNFEADPEFLVSTSTRGRRYVPGADVVIRNHYLSRRDIELKINSIGLRHRELATPKPETEKRVLVLGDSITAADTVPDQETFVRIIERGLEHTPPPRTVQVINAGIANVGITEEVNLFEDVAPLVAPDLTVLAFYLNDSRPPWGFSGEIGDRGWIRRHSILVDTLFVRLEEYRWIQKNARRHLEWVPSVDTLQWRTDREDFAKLVERARYDWGAAWREESWSLIENELERLQRASAATHSQLALLLFPVLYQLEAEFEDTSPQKRITDIAQKLHIPVLDLYPVLRSPDAHKLFYDHCHPTPEGHSVIAEAVTPFIRSLLKE